MTDLYRPDGSGKVLGMSTRDQILDAFETLLLREGERGASLNAVAKESGVSKGGLLYHFASKDALIAGVLGRLDASLEADLEQMKAGPVEAIEYFLRSSIQDTPDRRSERALQVLATLGHDDIILQALDMQRQWRACFEDHGLAPEIVTHIMLVSDGLYSDFSQIMPSLESENPDVRAAANDFLAHINDHLEDVIRHVIDMAGLN